VFIYGNTKKIMGYAAGGTSCLSTTTCGVGNKRRNYGKKWRWKSWKWKSWRKTGGKI